MSVIPETQIQHEVQIIAGLSQILLDDRRKHARDIAEEIVNVNLPQFESLRAKALGEINSQGLTEQTSNDYHVALNKLEEQYRDGYDITHSGDWYRCIQQAAGIHLLSLVRSGSRESGGISQQSHEEGHGGKTWPP